MSSKQSMPAFPITQSQYFSGKHDVQGMTLRDYFAAKAMQMQQKELNKGYNLDSVANTAYELADAMIKAREK